MVKEKNNDGIITDEHNKYIDKLLEIMEVELKTDLFGKEISYPDVRERYKQFTQAIRPETSSSPFNNAGLPKRKSEKKIGVKSKKDTKRAR